MTRQALYVVMTRGRTANPAYIATDAVDHACPDPVDGSDAPTARQVLEKVLESRAASCPSPPPSGSDTTRRLPSVVWCPIRTTLAAASSRERWKSLLTTTGLDPAIVAEINRSPAASALYATLDDVACAGHNVDARAVDEYGVVRAHGSLHRVAVAAIHRSPTCALCWSG
jgi:hypothetical protein